MFKVHDTMVSYTQRMTATISSWRAVSPAVAVFFFFCAETAPEVCAQQMFGAQHGITKYSHHDRALGLQAYSCYLTIDFVSLDQNLFLFTLSPAPRYRSYTLCFWTHVQMFSLFYFIYKWDTIVFVLLCLAYVTSQSPPGLSGEALILGPHPPLQPRITDPFPHSQGLPSF